MKKLSVNKQKVLKFLLKNSYWTDKIFEKKNTIYLTIFHGDKWDLDENGNRKENKRGDLNILGIGDTTDAFEKKVRRAFSKKKIHLRYGAYDSWTHLSIEF